MPDKPSKHFYGANHAEKSASPQRIALIQQGQVLRVLKVDAGDNEKAVEDWLDTNLRKYSSADIRFLGFYDKCESAAPVAADSNIKNVLQ